MSEPTLHEHELQRALAGHAATIQPGFDPDRLEAAMVRVDRMRTLRAGAAIASICVVVLIGLFATGAGESATPLEVVDQPDLTPAPLPDLPVIGTDTEEAEASTTTAAPTTTSPSTTSLAPLGDPPSHLDDAPITTAPPAVVDTTTTAPPTTLPPPTTTTTAPPATTTTTTTAIIGFSAAARYGTCEEDPPYDEYSGTAAPGATITVTSAWNAAATTNADGAGNWFLRVEFPDAPVGETFSVTVSDGATSKSFDFTRTG